MHDLIANPEDEAVKNLKPEALEGAKATTEMAGGVRAAVLGHGHGFHARKHHHHGGQYSRGTGDSIR